MFRGKSKVDLPIYVVHAYDGDRMVGESSIGLPSVAGGAAYTMYTAVRRAYRGRGLALALKLFTIEETAKQGVRRMRTNNDGLRPGAGAAADHEDAEGAIDHYRFLLRAAVFRRLLISPQQKSIPLLAGSKQGDFAELSY
jgi:GNAT superfamily N-acetyltransferase